jgi:hypothetical protein
MTGTIFGVISIHLHLPMSRCLSCAPLGSEPVSRLFTRKSKGGGIAVFCGLRYDISRLGDLRYDTPMKQPPDNPEFARFTAAMRTIVKVSKTELNRRIEATKKGKRSKVSASPDSAVSSSAAS